MVTDRLCSLLLVSGISNYRFKRSWLVVCGTLVVLSFGVATTAVAQSTSASFGSVNVGTTSTTLPVTLSFNASGTIGSTAVFTQGAPALDFADAGSGTCAVGLAFSAGQTCTANVVLTPKFAGTRYGAVVAYDTNGNAIATGYLQGTGIGPQISFLPGTETTIISAGLSYPSGVAVDGSGNVYIMDTNNSRLVKATPGPSGYSTSTVTSGLSQGGAYGIAVDGAGNLYVGDTGNQRVLKEEPSPTGYVETTIASGFGYPSAVAVDGSGNVFVIANDSILEFTPSSGGYAQSTVVAYVPNAQGLAVDSAANLYVAEQGYGIGIFAIYKETLTPNGYIQTALTVPGQRSSMSVAVDSFGNVYYLNYPNVYRQTLTPNGYVESTIVTGLTDIGGAYGVAVDGSGNLFIGYAGGNSVVKADFADPPTLNFANTAVNTTSPDSPLTVTLVNNGNAPLLFEVPSAGTNPSISQDFTLDSSGTSACPVVSSVSSTAETLASGASCALPISYTPTVPGPVSGSLTISDNTLNAVGPAYASQSVVLNGTNISPSFTLSSSSSSLILNLSGSATTTITVTPQAGFIVNASLSVSGLPNGVTAVFSPNPTTGTSTLTLTSDNTITSGTATVVITGVYGPQTASTSISLRTNGPVPYFTLSASPATITIPQGGSATSTVTVTGFNGFSGSVNLSSNNPTGVTASFSPSSTSGTSIMTLSAGTSALWGVPQWLQIQGSSGGLLETVSISVTVKLVPVITWPTPTPITYGTALGATQLNATANVPGTFTYSPAAGTVLSPGAQTLTATFTPTDTTDYIATTATISLTVNKATPAISWATPTPITYGAALSAIQLNATANVPGAFAYSPAAGTVLSAGTQTLSATFTPTDTTNYTTASATVPLTVNKATSTITWPVPLPMTYGTALGAAQLNATANVPGTFAYSPTVGTVLSAGTQTLSATFTPTDTTDYTTASTTVPLTVNKATPVITWPAPAPIAYGTALSSNQLNATANVPGTFVYTPAAGTVLPDGTNMLNVAFTPSDAVDFISASASVPLLVPGFTVTSSPSAVSITENGKATTTISINATGGFSGSVSLAISGLPKGVTATLSPNPATTTSTIFFSANGGATTGTSSVTITGTSGSLVQTTTIALTVVHK